jgi:transcriptional/translational regulatory protein YebC/TACO1
VGLWIEAQTDNRNRLGADVGRLLTQAGSSLGEAGSVAVLSC